MLLSAKFMATITSRSFADMSFTFFELHKIEILERKLKKKISVD